MCKYILMTIMTLGNLFAMDNMADVVSIQIPKVKVTNKNLLLKTKSLYVSNWVESFVEGPGKPLLINYYTDPEVDSFIGGSSLMPHNSPFYTSMGMAFSDHRAFELNPNDIWLLIIQGIHHHITINKAKYKDKFVDSKKDTSIHLIDYRLKLSASSELWNDVLLEFVDSTLSKTSGKVGSNIVISFSNTNKLYSTVFRSTYLSLMSNYIEYSVSTLCGIPEIRVKGNKQDWVKLKNQFKILANSIDMDWWFKQVSPNIDKIIAIYDGERDLEFWGGMYKIHEPQHSGDVEGINGWVSDFIPYIGTKKRMNWTKAVPYSNLPKGALVFKFLWNDRGVDRKMELFNGFIGAYQKDASKPIIPQVGWILIERKVK